MKPSLPKRLLICAAIFMTSAVQLKPATIRVHTYFQHCVLGEGSYIDWNMTVPLIGCNEFPANNSFDLHRPSPTDGDLIAASFAAVTVGCYAIPCHWRSSVWIPARPASQPVAAVMIWWVGPDS